jgi:glycosyltransferase involved in cell wall biosynthesis
MDAAAALPLSVCIITRDEQDRITQCLESVRWAGEVVIVDDFSSDDTPQICRSFANVRYHTRRFDGFGPQKRHCVSLAGHDWVLALDADEEVTIELQAEIAARLRDPGPSAGFRVRLRHLMFGSLREDSYPGGLRLFRRSRGTFTASHVHEHVEVDGPVGQLEGVILHRSRSFADFRSHFRIYAVKCGRRLTWWNAGWYLLLTPLAVFARSYAVRRMLIQGRAGLYVSVCRALTYLIAYVELAAGREQSGAATRRQESYNGRGSRGDGTLDRRNRCGCAVTIVVLR